MPKTRINCPNCRQPITADINQLFDVGQDPRAKQLILSGMFNLAQCPHCGYQGNLATPIVYHDPDKELLLTYFPPELGLPVNEQERLVGPLLKQVMDSLPVEKRKGYLLRPQTMFTLQSLVERVLEGEGITKEMIEAQQKRLALMQRLLEVTSDDVLQQMAKENDALLDADFFNLFNRLMSAALQARDENSAKQLNDLQAKLLPLTTFGKDVKAQSQEVEAAMQSLQKLGKNLTRENLLDIMAQAPNETRLNVLVSLARQAMDYNFFQILTDRIDKAQGDERQKLLDLRTKLLSLTQRVDKELEARASRSIQLLNEILKNKDIAEATRQNLPAIDDFFVTALNDQMEAARKDGDLDRIGKLNQVLGVLKQASEPPQELALIEEMLDSPDEAAMQKALDEHKQDITPEFIDTLGALMAQMENSEEKDIIERLNQLYRLALRISMQNSMKQ
jgi:hypothetical protein